MSWFLGLIAAGVAFTGDSAKRIARVVRHVEGDPFGGGAPGFGGAVPIRQVYLGKTDASHAKGASGTVSIYAGATAGSESDTGVNVTAWNRFADVDSGKWVHVTWRGNGWDLSAAECST